VTIALVYDKEKRENMEIMSRQQKLHCVHFYMNSLKGLFIMPIQYCDVDINNHFERLH